MMGWKQALREAGYVLHDYGRDDLIERSARLIELETLGVGYTFEHFRSRIKL